MDPRTGQAYVPYDLSAWGGSSCRTLSKERAVAVLQSVADVIRGWVRAEKSGHLRLMRLAEDQPIVSLISQWLGRVEMPPLHMWSPAEDHLDRVQSALRAGNVAAAQDRLRKARSAYDESHGAYAAFKEGNISGAERAKQGLEIAQAAGAAAASALPGGLAVNAAYGVVQETAQQSSEIHFKVRKDINWLQIIRRATADVALGLAGEAAKGVLANQFARLSKSAFRTWPKGSLKALNAKIVPLGFKPVTRFELLGLWQKRGIDFLTSMGTKVLTEPAKITLDELCTKNTMPTKEQILAQMAARFWAQEGGIEAFIMWARAAATPA